MPNFMETGEYVSSETLITNRQTYTDYRPDRPFVKTIFCFRRPRTDISTKISKWISLVITILSVYTSGATFMQFLYAIYAELSYAHKL